MDAAWALYEAYIKMLTGEVDTALVYGFGKSSAGVLRRILSRQTDPYTVAPLWPDSVSMAGLQARMGLDTGKWTAEQMARVALDSFATARRVGLGEAGDQRRRNCSTGRSSPTRCGGTTSHRSPTAPLRSCSRPATGRANCGKPGLDHRNRTSHRVAVAGRTRPHGIPVNQSRGQGRHRRADPTTSTWPRFARRSPTST